MLSKKYFQFKNTTVLLDDHECGNFTNTINTKMKLDYL